MKISRDLLDSVKGFVDRDEGQRLYEIALEAGRQGPCLEIGSYCGKSTIYLGAACKQNNSILFRLTIIAGPKSSNPVRNILTLR